MSRPAALCAILVVAIVLCFSACDQAPALASIQIIPSGASLTTVGQTLQYKAIATYQRPNHSPTTSDVTSQVAWSSSEPSVSTISSAGLATAVGSGNTLITASLGGGLGTTTLSVSATAVHDLSSIAIVPSSQAITTVGEPAQFIAIGTYTTSPMTADLTNQVTWHSSDVSVATINAAGLALGNGLGTTTISAAGQAKSGATITGTSTLTFSTALGGGGVVLPALTVYSVGLGTGTVTSPGGIINCTPTGGAGCTANFPLGTTVVLTAVPATGSTFGGWSSNCIVNGATCTITLNNNEPVGAIFN
jgi:hypothetical protein